MDHVFDSVGDVKIGRDSWRLRVRVLRLWRVPSFKNPEQAISLEMVLVDEKVRFIFILFCICSWLIILNLWKFLFIVF